MPRQLGLVERARIFAICRHAGQFREHKAHQPFIIHPKEVAELVRDSGGNEKEIAAAWLHDTVEDTETTLAEIEEFFGPELREIVDGLTDPPEFKGLPLLVRKARQAERVRLFEVGLCFIQENGELKQVEQVAGVWAGRCHSLNG